MFTQASLPRAGDPQHQHRLLLRCVPSQGARLLHYRINFLRQGAAAEVHSAAALHAFLRQSLRILENKISMDAHNYFPTWVCSPCVWVWFRSFEIPNGFARGSKLRSAVREGLLANSSGTSALSSGECLVQLLALVWLAVCISIWKTEMSTSSLAFFSPSKPCHLLGLCFMVFWYI